MCLALKQGACSPTYREWGNMTELSKKEYSNLAHSKQYKHACAFSLSTGLCPAERQTNDFLMVSFVFMVPEHSHTPANAVG